MSAEQGWIGEPQQTVQWHDSHYSRMADRISQEQQDHHPGLTVGHHAPVLKQGRQWRSDADRNAPPGESP
jgi:hypothetical protein